ncbi:MarR family winged helix-turn-helix transcriptional regulator [Marinobacterium sp. YM272]|uniref:MarR family winged helix-turn-helix transcriptional regulator n=1 Tax=Marinobacterium sp. YM272 TaxID=3421654 RepID=UPI003D7FA940
MTTKSSVTDRNSLNLDRYVPALVTALANKLGAGASSCYRKNFGVGVVDWRILAMLAVESDISANRICEVTALDKAATSRALKQLEENGDVEFRKDDQDARRILIRLTAKGKALHDQVLKVALRREALLLADFSDAELDIFIELLHRMKARLDVVNAYDPAVEDA